MDEIEVDLRDAIKNTLYLFLTVSVVIFIIAYGTRWSAAEKTLFDYCISNIVPDMNECDRYGEFVSSRLGFHNLGNCIYTRINPHINLDIQECLIENNVTYDIYRGLR